MIVPSIPGLGEDMGLTRLGRISSPWTWVGMKLALHQLLLLTPQQGNLAKMTPNGPLEKHYQRPFCLTMHQCRGRECYAWHAWMGFQPTKSKPHFLSGREEGGRRGSQEARMLPAFKWEGPLSGMSTLAEEWGRGMNFRNVVVNKTLEIDFKTNDL